MTQNADLFRVDAEKASSGAALRPEQSSVERCSAKLLSLKLGRTAVEMCADHDGAALVFSVIADGG